MYSNNIDVVVVGLGYAGAAAAIEAHDTGANVLVVEKMDNSGGNSRVSAGSLLVAEESKIQQLKLINYLYRLCSKRTPKKVIETLVQGSLELEEWIKKRGGTPYFPEKLLSISDTYPRSILGSSFPKLGDDDLKFKKMCIKGKESIFPSVCLWNLLKDNIDSRKIPIVNSTQVIKISKDESGVNGVVVQHQDGSKDEINTKAVILSCGGHENNPAMNNEHFDPIEYYYLGTPGNTGDGVRMVQELGADLWHMSRLSCVMGFKADEFDAAFGIFIPDIGFIYVDRDGNRFCNETNLELHELYRCFNQFDTKSSTYSREKFWVIFDENTKAKRAITWNISGYNRDLYQWSEDNSVEIEKGWIKKAESLSELSSITGMDYLTMTETMRKYNSQDNEDEFGREPSTVREMKPPYYAIEVGPALLNTQGGARRDEQARVLTPNNEPINGLFSAGEFGSIWGFLYQGSTNISECLVFGRIAGRNAAKLSRK